MDSRKRARRRFKRMYREVGVGKRFYKVHMYYNNSSANLNNPSPGEPTVNKKEHLVGPLAHGNEVNDYRESVYVQEKE